MITKGFFALQSDVPYLHIVRHLEEDVAFGVHVFHCVATVLWIRHVHVLGSNFEVFPVLNKNHVYSKFLLNTKAKQLSCESEIHQQQLQLLNVKRQRVDLIDISIR